MSRLVANERKVESRESDTRRPTVPRRPFWLRRPVSLWSVLSIWPYSKTRSLRWSWFWLHALLFQFSWVFAPYKRFHSLNLTSSFTRDVIAPWLKVSVQFDVCWADDGKQASCVYTGCFYVVSEYLTRVWCENNSTASLRLWSPNYIYFLMSASVVK